MDREQRLRQEHAFFFDNASDLLCVLDIEGRFVDVNPAWERLFGFTAGELRGQRVGAFLHPEDAAPELGDRDLSPDPATLHRFDVRCRTHAGNYRWLRWKSIVDRDHGLRYTVARDITSPAGAAEGSSDDARKHLASQERIDSIAVLAKPFTPAHLTQLVREVLDQPATVRLEEGARAASRENRAD